MGKYVKLIMAENESKQLLFRTITAQKKAIFKGYPVPSKRPSNNCPPYFILRQWGRVNPVSRIRLIPSHVYEVCMGFECKIICPIKISASAGITNMS